jgi:hypothetical protein
MNIRKTALIIGACTLGILISGGSVAVARTVQTYDGACSDLTGFPGLLQKAGFITRGTCIFKSGRCGGPCFVDHRLGHCITIINRKRVICDCFVRHTSQ